MNYIRWAIEVAEHLERHLLSLEMTSERDFTVARYLADEILSAELFLAQHVERTGPVEADVAREIACIKQRASEREISTIFDQARCSTLH